MNILMVMIGGFTGAVIRFLISQVFEKYTFPYGTTFVNITGAFIIGLCIGFTIDDALYLLFGVGFCGAYTTFSTMSRDFLEMLIDRKYVQALIYLSISYGLGCLMTFLGIWLGIMVNQ